MIAIQESSVNEEGRIITVHIIEDGVRYRRVHGLYGVRLVLSGPAVGDSDVIYLSADQMDRIVAEWSRLTAGVTS